jgi:hypothetical protein
MPAAGVMQLAAVTFVPVAHPFLHDRPAAAAEVVRPSLTVPGTDQDVVRRVDVCLACLASLGMTVPREVEPQGCPRVARSPVPGPSARTAPAGTVSRANRVRAPPLT